MQQAKKQTPRRGPAAKGKKRAALSAQQTIPYVRMLPDGVCQLPGGLYTKTVEYEDINYSVASTEDQTAIFSGWSSFLNYFDSSLPFQLSFINRRSHSRSRYKVNIPQAEDDFNSVRAEFTGMLKNQIARSNNGIERSKYITFGIPAESLDEARPRLERVEADVMSNFKRLGVPSEPMDGRARLALLHGQMHPGSREPFRFSWGDIAKTGLGTKDFIAPDSFDFRQPRLFRMGQYWGAASYLQILASELSDKLLAEILELDAEMTVTLHIQTVDQLKAIKTIKGKISDIGKMKVEEQRKAVRAGYDPDILPPDLITFSKDAAELLADLQSRNERMFLLTFTVVNLAPTRQRLENDIFTVGGIAQKYNCTLKRLDWQQEQGFVSSLALGGNEVEIQRGMTTSSTAIFIPFMTRELRMAGPSLYYGMNALSHNVIMADRKKLKSANGLYLGSTGSGKSFAAKRELLNVFLTIPQDRIIIVDPMGEYAPLVRRLGGQVIEIAPDSPNHISLPLRLIAEVAVIHHFTAEVEGPVALGVKLHGVVVVVRFAQPDTLEAAEVVDGVLAEAASQALVGVILRGDLPLRIAAGCAQQEKQQHQSRQKIWLFSLHVTFLLILHRSNTTAKKCFDRSHPYPPQHRGARRIRKDRYKCRCP